MTEIASLRIEIDATAVDDAADALERLDQTAGWATDSLAQLARSARETMATVDVLSGGADRLASAFDDAMARLDALSGGANRLGVSLKEAKGGLEDLSQSVDQLDEAARQTVKSITDVDQAESRLAETHRKAAKAAGLNSDEMISLKTSFLGVGAAILNGTKPLDAFIDKVPDIAEVFMKAQARGESLKDSLISVGKEFGLLKTKGAAVTATFEEQAAAALAASIAQGDMAVATMAGSISSEASVAGAAAVTAANGEIAASATTAAAAEAVALAPLALIAAGIALTIGAIAGGFSLAAFEMNRHTKGLNDNLGLTKEQLDRIKDKSITTGDVMHGVWNLAASSLKKAFGPAIDNMKEKFGQWLDDTISNAVTGASALAAAFVAAFDAVKAVWGMLPGALGDLIIQSVNFILGGFNKLLQLMLPKLNPMIQLVKDVAKAAGHPLQIELFDAKTDYIKLLDNPFAGQFEKAQKTLKDTFASSFSKHLAEFRGAITSAADAAIASILEAHRKRMIDEGGKPTPKPPPAPKPDSGVRADVDDSTQDLVNQTAAFDANAAAAMGAQAALSVFAGAAAGVSQSLSTAGDALAQTDQALDATKDKLAAVGRQGQEAAKGMAQAFGDVGKSLGDMLNIFNSYAQKQAEFARKRAEYSNGATADADKLAQVNRDAAGAQMQYFGDIAKAAEGMVDKKSNAYQALVAAEKVYRAFEFAMSVKAALQAAWEAAAKISADQAGVVSHAASAAAHETLHMAEATTGAAAGAGRMFGQLGVAAFPFVAAMIAVMASLGSGSAGGSVPGEHDAEKRQEAQGAGSVLGDSKAKSESIQKSLDLVADHTNNMLEFYNPMLAALKSIDGQIGRLASALARSLGVGGMLDTAGLKLGTSGRAPSLSNLGFGSVTTRTLQDQGLAFSAGTLGAILAGGVQGKTYQQILSETKKSAFGLTYSTSTSKKTISGALDPEFARQTTLLIGSLRDGVLSAASVLGIEGAVATLDAFKLDLGKISLKDLKGDEITAALEAVFGKAADGMAAAVMPGLAQFQKVGEGAFETLTRLARDYQVVDVTLSSIGKVFGAVGLASVEARERLVDLAGGLDSFTDQTNFYAETFLSEAERLAPVQAAVSGELARLGLTGVKTREQFKSLVQGLDVSTQAGAELFTALMTLAPAFAAVTEESQALSDAKDALSGAYDRESGALADTRDRFADLAKGLHDFGAGLYSGPAAALSPEEQYRAAQAAFQETAGLAAQGNEQALGDLQGVSQAYLDASKAYFASSEGYFADLTAVRDAVSAAEASAGTQVDMAQRQLDTMTAQVGQLIELNTHVVSVAEAIAALQALLGGGSAGAPQTFPAATKASNDNTAAVVTAIQELQTEVAGVGDQLTADKVQRGAIAQQQDERLAALEDQLAALRRAAQA
ncbi:ABC-type transporter Mla subunit MlaD [Caulobacter ginsengisoli]|uniref:ABC-type transporter Mla subunit MlaD n=1 Tax=Caulobacter ginsengisoli TaxID=400775 RepID=A0ABU0IKU5_9CAUL|nr:hypothetical protein [Caulobacter ginsengisoli]MDQ0462635.1 ABC-type transporter Mla subunit MlaD [Caulobacter ginsengisoli]